MTRNNKERPLDIPQFGLKKPKMFYFISLLSFLVDVLFLVCSGQVPSISIGEES